MVKRGSRITIVLEDDLKLQVAELANDNNRSISDFVRLVLLDFVQSDSGDEEEIVDDDED